jgi:hypothetical protein
MSDPKIFLASVFPSDSIIDCWELVEMTNAEVDGICDAE